MYIKPDIYANDKSYLNRWGGVAYSWAHVQSKIKSYKEEGLEYCTEMCYLILAHIRYCWCSTDEEYIWMVRWLAANLQRPGLVMGKVPVVAGKEGVGKTMIFHLLGRLLGESNYALCQTMDDLLGKFNASVADKTFAFLDEAFWSKDPKQADQLKSIATAGQTRSEKKGKDVKYEDNHRNIAMATNHISFAMPASETARRYIGFLATTDFLDAPFYKERFENLLHYTQTLWNIVDSPHPQTGIATDRGLVALAEVLYNMDLADWDYDRMPNTYLTMRNKFTMLSGPRKWWYEGLVNGCFHLPEDQEEVNQHFSTSTMEEDDPEPVRVKKSTVFDGVHLLASYRNSPEADKKGKFGLGELRDLLTDVVGQYKEIEGKGKRLATFRRNSEAPYYRYEDTTLFVLPPLNRCRELMEAFMPGAKYGWEERQQCDFRQGDDRPLQSDETAPEPVLIDCKWAAERKTRLEDATLQNVALSVDIATKLAPKMVVAKKSQQGLTWEDLKIDCQTPLNFVRAARLHPHDHLNKSN